jgi:hypothetical protein
VRVTYAGAADNIGQVQQLLLALTPERAIPAQGACALFICSGIVNKKASMLPDNGTFSDRIKKGKANPIKKSA